MGVRRGKSVAGPMAVSAPWRRALRRHLAVLLVIKFAALALLWAWFFSPPHRLSVDGRAAGLQLAVVRPDVPAAHTPAAREGERP